MIKKCVLVLGEILGIIVRF